MWGASPRGCCLPWSARCGVVGADMAQRPDLHVYIVTFCWSDGRLWLWFAAGCAVAGLLGLGAVAGLWCVGSGAVSGSPEPSYLWL